MSFSPFAQIHADISLIRAYKLIWLELVRFAVITQKNGYFSNWKCSHITRALNNQIRVTTKLDQLTLTPSCAICLIIFLQTNQSDHMTVHFRWRMRVLSFQNLMTKACVCKNRYLYKLNTVRYCYSIQHEHYSTAEFLEGIAQTRWYEWFEIFPAVFSKKCFYRIFKILAFCGFATLKKYDAALER